MLQVLPFWRDCLSATQAERADGNVIRTELEQFRWMIEEFRVSEFAQRLGTVVPVSARRLEKACGKIADHARLS
jgi:ATP-dependent helicase HrpA